MKVSNQRPAPARGLVFHRRGDQDRRQQAEPRRRRAAGEHRRESQTADDPEGDGGRDGVGHGAHRPGVADEGAAEVIRRDVRHQRADGRGASRPPEAVVGTQDQRHQHRAGPDVAGGRGDEDGQPAHEEDLAAQAVDVGAHQRPHPGGAERERGHDHADHERARPHVLEVDGEHRLDQEHGEEQPETGAAGQEEILEPDPRCFGVRFHGV